MINVPGRLEKASQKRWHSSQIMKGGQKFIKQKKDVHVPPEMLHVLRPTEAQCFGGMVRDSGCWNTGFMQGSDRNERAVGNKSQILSTAHKGKMLLIPFYQGRKKNELSQHHIPRLSGRLVPSFLPPPLSDSRRPVSLSALLPLSAAGSLLVFYFLYIGSPFILGAMPCGQHVPLAGLVSDTQQALSKSFEFYHSRNSGIKWESWMRFFVKSSLTSSFYIEFAYMRR